MIFAASKLQTPTEILFWETCINLGSRSYRRKRNTLRYIQTMDYKEEIWKEFQIVAQLTHGYYHVEYNLEELKTILAD